MTTPQYQTLRRELNFARNQLTEKNKRIKSLELVMRLNREHQDRMVDLLREASVIMEKGIPNTVDALGAKQMSVVWQSKYEEIING